MIARHYHWSEADILRLPASRRARYLSLIARDAALAGAAAQEDARW